MRVLMLLHDNEDGRVVQEKLAFITRVHPEMHRPGKCTIRARATYKLSDSHAWLRARVIDSIR